MSKVLYIEASPRGERSASTEVAKHFLDAYRAQNPSDTIETLDIWKVALPEFNNEVLNAKYAIMHGKAHTPEQAVAWQDVVRIIEHFKSADKYVLSLPMWNFSIPYKLKHYIDLLLQPGLTVSYSPETGYKGLVPGKPLVAIYARGGAYAPGTGAEAYDLQSPYVRQAFGFIGFTDIREIFVEPTATPTGGSEGIAAAKIKAEEVAKAL